MIGSTLGRMLAILHYAASALYITIVFKPAWYKSALTNTNRIFSSLTCSIPLFRINPVHVLLLVGLVAFNAYSVAYAGHDGEGPIATRAGSDVLLHPQPTGSAASQLLLDQYGDARAAYSLRRLSSNFDYAVRVQRGENGDTKDVGFADDGSLDTETITSFCAGTDCRAVVWYDQSGQGRHLEVANNSSGPLIAAAGNLVTNSAGNASLSFDSDARLNRLFPNPQDDITIFSVIEYLVPGATQLYGLGSGYDRPGGLWLFHSAGKIRVRYNTSSGWEEIGSGNVIVEEPSLYALRMNGTHLDLFRQGDPLIQEENHGVNASTESDRVTIAEGGDRPHLMESLLIYDWVDDEKRRGIEDLLNNGYFADAEARNTSALLPQTYNWQVTLYDWLASLDKSDVSSPGGKVTFSPGSGNKDALFPLYVTFESSGRLPRADFLRMPAKNFVLDDGNGNGFEGDGNKIRVSRAFTGSREETIALMEAAWWMKLDGPGIDNPYLNHTGIKRRLLAQGAVELTMHVDYLQSNTVSHPDFGMMNMLDVAVAFYYSRDVLDNTTRRAFLDGFGQLIDVLASNSSNYPRDVNTNMDTKGIAATVYIARAAEEEGNAGLAQKAHDAVRTWVLGSPNTPPDKAEGDTPGVIFHSAGYVGEKDGPETSYNGISIYYMAKGAGLVKDDPAWAWLAGPGGVVDRMARFKLFQHFPEPDGRVTGPSGYAKRSAFSYVRDQSGSTGRDALVALISEHGLPVVDELPGTGVNKMEREIEKTLSDIEFGSENTDMKNWRYGERWTERHGGIFLDHYRSGTYGDWESLEDGNRDLFRIPWKRSQPFSEVFGRSDQAPEFWAYKGDDGSRKWGFFAESVSDAGEGYGSWRGAGSIQTFWTPETGVVINTRNSKHNYDAVDWPAIDTWATHHLWGVDGGGKRWSSGRQRVQKRVEYDRSNNPTQVTVVNTPERQGGSWSGSVQYERTMAVTSNGLKVTSTLTSDQSDKAKEIWETIPVYLVDNGQDESTKTTIEYLEGSNWKKLGTSLETTDHIRLGRNFGDGKKYVYIVFEDMESVKLSKNEWQCDYQDNDYYRNIHIDLHGNPGDAKPMPRRTSVSYGILTTSTFGGDPLPINNEETGASAIPGGYTLQQNYPNPFSDYTTLTLEVPSVSHVELSVFDIAGRLVSRLLDGILQAGKHQYILDSEGLTSGVYLVRMKTPEGIYYRRATLIQ